MSVDVDICNSALIKLGAERINALTDDNKRARLCQEQYPKIRKRVLRSHPWTFGIKRSVLSPLTEVPVFTESNGSTLNMFQLPIDSLRVVSINSNYNYKLEADKLLTTLSVVNLSYISEVVPEAFYDVNFTEALASAMAADLCYAITQSNTLRQGLMQEFEFWISQARSFNSQEVSPENFNFDEWGDSRSTGETDW